MRLSAILLALFMAGFSLEAMQGMAAVRSAFASNPAQGVVSDEPAQSPPPDQAQPPVEQKNADGQSEVAPSADKTESGNSQSPQEPPKPKANTVRKRRAHSRKSIPHPTADGEPRKIVVHQGSVSEPIAQILPGLTEEEANRQRESSEQLLASAESHLKTLAEHSVNPSQQELIVQIRQYMEGARSALKESDFQRAHTLALKAYLLSDDLMKH